MKTDPENDIDGGFARKGLYTAIINLANIFKNVKEKMGTRRETMEDLKDPN